ncbi:MAG TPA: hypothetical protein VGH37_12335 [Candidatus Acidoferrum sp.]
MPVLGAPRILAFHFDAGNFFPASSGPVAVQHSGYSSLLRIRTLGRANVKFGASA